MVIFLEFIRHMWKLLDINSHD